MLFPFLVATDDPDPFRRDERAQPEPDDDSAREETETEPSPALRSDPVVDEPVVDEPDTSEPVVDEPVVPVALVPAAAQPEMSSASTEAVGAAWRDDSAAQQKEEAPPRSPMQRFVLAALLIAAAALIGYVVSRPSSPDVRTLDAVARSAEAARQLQFVLDTQEPMEARRFVRNEFGWRVGVPIFAGVELQGVAVADVAREVEVPVFLYADTDGRDVAVFVYSYALLDQVPDRLTLARADLDDLALGEPVRRPTGPTDALLWRDRDDIYIAVSALDADALSAGLTMAR